MRKLALAALAVLLLAAGATAAYVVQRRHAGRDVLGSSSVEFVTTARARRVLPSRPQGIVWPQFGYDAGRQHVALGSKLRPPFRAVWTAGGNSLLEFPPAIAYGRLYVSTASGRVVALSARTGARAWAFASHRCAGSSPAVGTYAGGTVYATFLQRHPCTGKDPADGEVVALSVGTGEVRWRTPIGASESSPLLASGGLVYVGDWRGVVSALDSRTGTLRWSYRTGGPVKGGVASDGRNVYVGSYDGHLYALAARTGRLVWRASGDPRLFGRSRFYSTPAVAYGRVYIGSTDGKVYSFGAASGMRRWSHRTGGYVYGSPAVWRGLVLVGSYDGAFYAFDAATGRERWRFRAAGPISGSATVVAGVAYVATLRGRTYGLRAATGRLLWTFRDGAYASVVADRQRLYLVGYSTVYGLVAK